MAIKIRDLFISIGIEADEASIKRIDKGINQIKSSANLTGLAIKGLSIAISGMIVTTSLFLKQAGEFEQATIAFETMLGSAKKAKDLLSDLQQFAAKTPFQFKELVTLSKRLLAFQFGAEEIIPTLNTLGNVAAGVGREKLPQLIKALGDVRAAGRLRGLEVRQFIDAGVGIEKAVAAVTGKSIREVGDLISKRAISFEVTRQALDHLAKTKFFNLMIKQSKTLLGALSNTIDILQIFAIEIGNEMLPAAKQILGEFLKFLEVNKKLIKSRTTAFFKSLGRFLFRVWKISKAVVIAVDDMAKVFGGLEKVIQTVVFALAALVGLQILSAIGNITIGIMGMVRAMNSLKVATALTNAALAMWPIIVGIGLIALALMIEDITSFFQGKDSVTALILEAFEKKYPDAFLKTKAALFAIKTAFSTVFETLNEWGTTLGITIFNLVRNFKDLFDTVKNFGGSIGIKLFDLANPFLDKFGVGASPSNSPASSSASQGPSSVTVTSPITVNVPEGTPPELVGSSLQAGISSVFGDILRNTQRNTEPVTEW